jgi:cytidylate kinase
VQAICISRGTFVGGEELAERVAQKLGYQCLSREALVEAATREGIQVGKLEMAVTRPGRFTERLALERDHYLAFVTAALCDRALDGGVVFHGRTGHLLLRGIGHALRVRVVSSEEHRIQAAQTALGIERGQAQQYLREVDEDFGRWAHALHGITWEDASTYDLTVNLEQLSIANAAVALMTVAQLPDFQITPASRKAMVDRRLAARCRLELARDEATYPGRFTVRADVGVVTVSYLPQDARYAEAAARLLAGVDGVATVHTTMATTNIMWVQEAFDASSETFHEVAEIAAKWNAAVELVSLADGPVSDPDTAQPAAEPDEVGPIKQNQPRAANGGIEDDDEPRSDGTGLAATLDELARLGRSGGGRRVAGGARSLLGALDPSVPYSLVVLGDVFRGRGHSARIRMKRELQAFLSDHIKAPVVASEELRQQYLFGRKDILRAAATLGLVLAIYLAVFLEQGRVLHFLLGDWGNGGNLGHIVAATTVLVLVPLVAFTYGTFAKSLLKLVKIE